MIVNDQTAWLLMYRGSALTLIALLALVLVAAVPSIADAAVAPTAICTEGAVQPPPLSSPLTAYEALSPPRATAEQLPGGGTIYSERQDGLTIETPVPPRSFNPATATQAELARYYFPPRPSGVRELESWDQTFGSLKAPAPPGGCPRSVHNDLNEQPSAAISLGESTVPMGEAIHSIDEDSSNWAGFVAVAKGHPTHFGAVSGEYSQPKGYSSECSNDHVASWTGLGGNWDDQPLIQSGTEIGSSNNYLAWWEYLNSSGDHGENFELQIHPGDQIQDYSTYRPSGGPANTAQGLASGTSPSVAALSGGGYEAVFQANNNDLYGYASSGATTNTGLGMAPSTSPSIAGLSTGGWEAAFQANNTVLWTVGSSGNSDWNLGMMGHTSPSIASVGGGFEVAFTSNAGQLWTVGSAGDHDWGYAIASGTSPSIAGLSNGGFAVAFQGTNGNLYIYISYGGLTNTGLGMAAGTSPSISGLPNGKFEVAFQANNSDLYAYSSSGQLTNTAQGMAAGVSPSIATGSELVSFRANNGNLYVYSPQGIINTTQGMASGTSPSTTLLSGGGYETVFQANTSNLFTFSGEAAVLWVIDHTTGIYGEKVISPAGSFYNGSSAEFIDERPSIGGSFSNLKDFNINDWKEARVYNNVSAGWEGIGSPEHVRLHMYNGLHQLAAPGYLSSGTTFQENWIACK